MPEQFDSQVIGFDNLENCDLIIDAVYAGGNRGNFGDDPISKILSTGNQGGFRVRGNESSGYSLIALHSLLNDLTWPDDIDAQNGLVTYYGDNKTPGRELHDTNKGGNKLFQLLFQYLHSSQIEKIPPIFMFVKSGDGRDLIFKGILVPGYPGLPDTEDLVAIWKVNDDKRFQNYRASFSILDIPIVKREWINDIIDGNPNSTNAPNAWMKWSKSGIYTVLRSEQVMKVRSKKDQLPSTKEGLDVLSTIRDFYADNYFGFEKCAAEIALMMDSNIISYDLTQRTVDGGRDAIGIYKIGLAQNSIGVDFALEAKCYNINNSAGVKEIARLISRLRHRQFGIFVTTSYVGTQAYKELREDLHPVILLTGGDIVQILKSKGYDSESRVLTWLKSLGKDQI